MVCQGIYRETSPKCLIMSGRVSPEQNRCGVCHHCRSLSWMLPESYQWLLSSSLLQPKVLSSDKTCNFLLAQDKHKPPFGALVYCSATPGDSQPRHQYFFQVVILLSPHPESIYVVCKLGSQTGLCKKRKQLFLLIIVKHKGKAEHQTANYIPLLQLPWA